MTTHSNKPVPSNLPQDLLFNAEKADQFVNSDELNYVDRFGQPRKTLEGIAQFATQQTQVLLAGLGYLPPVAYTVGLNMTAANQTVTSGGVVYAPKLADLPFTTSGVFETAKFRVVQGVVATDLSAGTGAELMGTDQDFDGSVERTQASRNRDFLNLADAGITPAADPGTNAAKLNKLIDEALARGIRDLYVAQDITLDGTVEIPKRTQVRFAGPGRLINVYRQMQAPISRRPYMPRNDMNPARCFRAISRTNSPVIVFAGDSIMTPGPDAIARTQSVMGLISEGFMRQNPEKTFTFHNRAIGGQTWLQFNTKPSAFLSWYTDHDRDWIPYLNDLEPHGVGLLLGTNDKNGMNAGAVVSSVAKIKAFTKRVPDIFFITNPVAALSTRIPDGAGTGFVQPVFQEGYDYAAGWVRTYAKFYGYGLIDLNRMQVAARDGYDVTGGPLKKVETVTTGAHTASKGANSFAYSGTCSGASWAEGRVLKVKCGLGPEDFLFIAKTAGKFVFSGTTDPAVGTYASIATNVAVPAGSFDFEVSVTGDVAHLMIDADGGTGKKVIAETPVIKYGGTFLPQIEWQDAGGTGPFTSLTYLSGYGEALYARSVTDEEVWGPSGALADVKEPYGGNGVNHFSSQGIELIVRPVVEAADLRAPLPVLDEVDLTLGAGTTALTAFAKAQRVGRLVKLTGTITSTTTPGGGATVFTVPEGFRPRKDGIRFGAVGGPLFQHVGAGIFKCEVGPINTLYPLDNISYFID